MGYSFIQLTCLFFTRQNVVTLEEGKLVQKQTCDGRETTFERAIVDGKLIMVRNVTLFCLQIQVFFSFRLSSVLHVTEIATKPFM